MLRKILPAILVCSLFAISACVNMGSALKEGDEVKDEVTKLGTPVELPDTSNKAVVEKFIAAHPRWQGDTDGDTMFLEFNSSAASVSIFSLKKPDPVTFSFEVSDDGDIITTNEDILLDLSDSMEELTVGDVAGSYSVKMLYVDIFKICDQSKDESCAEQVSIYHMTIPKSDSGINVFGKQGTSSAVMFESKPENGVDPLKINLLLFQQD